MMKTLRLFTILFFAALGSACATKTLDVRVPSPQVQPNVIGYVEIKEINDLRKFERSPSDPSTPSIEGDFVDDKDITDKVIGRMRHGMYHKALWNYTIKGDKDIYDVCREIVSSSLSSAGYEVVATGSDVSGDVIPVAVDILQFWAWMQPKFNIDLNFDGEIRIRTLTPEETIEISAEGHHHFSTGFAGGSAWTSLIEKGVVDLDKNLVLKVKSELSKK